MEGDANTPQQRRPRRILRRSAAAAVQPQGQVDGGERERRATRFTTAASNAETALTRAPAPRLAGPSAVLGTPPRKTATATTAALQRPLGPTAATGADASPPPPSPEPAVSPQSISSAATAAMESAMAGRRLLVDRTLFSPAAFSPALFVNNISQRLLYPVLQRHRAEQKRLVAEDPEGAGGNGNRGGGGSSPGSLVGSEAARLLGSDGTSLFGNRQMPFSVRARVGAMSGGGDGSRPGAADGGGPTGKGSREAEGTDFAKLASLLTSTLEEAAEQVRHLLEEEDLLLHRDEVRCKRVEIQEKRRLAAVRLGLEGTSARLQLYENRVSNAQAATAGIEQHLAQSNARVQRGKSVSQLLRYFSMMTNISAGELRTLLESISVVRKAQRAAVTARWAAGHVSAFEPRFYTTRTNIVLPPSTGGRNSGDAMESTPASRTASTTKRLAAREEDAGGADEGEGTTAAAAASDSQPAAGRRRPRVFRKGGRRRSGAASLETSPAGPSMAVPAAPQPDRPARALSPRNTAGLGDRSPSVTTGGGGQEGNAADDAGDGAAKGNGFEEDSGGVEDGEDEDGAAVLDLTQVRMQRAEAVAVAAGLDRVFALRYCTEAQVEWCQRLVLLANELGDLAKNSKNIHLYVDWLRKELVSDLFHVVTCFNDFYDEHPHTAVHQAYGRALLKTLGRVSSLYNALMPSNDELLSLFFSRSMNDMGVVLFTEWSPRPLPGLPPLTQASEMRAMEHYRLHTDKELRTTFRCLLDRIRRNVVVVETIFGVTNTARQQLLFRVTDGVVKPFLCQQIKLAETQATMMQQAEGKLTPRTKRRSAARVADVIAYHHTMETRLFTFYEDYMKELKGIFSANEVEFLSRLVDTIFVGRAAYSRQRPELGLLQRYFTIIEEKYTRNLHPIPDECFDLREAHMAKMKEVMTCLTEVAGRVRLYTVAAEVGPYIFELIKTTFVYVGECLDAELRKVLDSVRNDRDTWRVKPRSEEELLRPPKPESQQCAMRMLLFAQSSLMSLGDAINAICMPLLQQYPRLAQDVEEARTSALEAVDERAERLLNMCVQAILLRSLSILTHYQLKNDYIPKADTKNIERDAVAPPCTRACTLFCYYITRQFDMAGEFIRLSNGQLSQKSASSVTAPGGAVGVAVHQQHQAARAAAVEAVSSSGRGARSVVENTGGAPSSSGAFSAPAVSGLSGVRARARTMNLQQLLYGDGGPSSFVRTLGVCLYRGISAHLKTFSANDRGALIYKQDVTAYKEAMAPLTSTPGLGGAVVEVLFQLLKETSSLLIMPLDHIREVKESGSLRLLSAGEKMRYLRIRQDVRAAMKIIAQ